MYQAGTLSANPVGMAAGLATLQKLERLNVHALLSERSSAFCTTLNNDLAQAGLDLCISHVGSLLWFRPTKPDTINRPEQVSGVFVQFYQRFFHECLQRGIYLAPSAFEVGFLSLAHTEEILQQVRHKFIDAARAAHARQA